MALDTPTAGEEMLDEMVEALRAEVDVDALDLVAEERFRTLRGLDDFWSRAWEQYREEDLPPEAWRNLVAARWSRPWSIEGDYRCMRFGWQGQHAMRMALGVIECRRRMLRDIEREQWRLPPDERCDKTTAIADKIRAQDLLRLREVYDVVRADLDKSHALLVRLRKDLASDRRFRSSIGLSHRATGEIIGPAAQINRFGLAVVECRRRLCADVDRAQRPPEHAAGRKTAREQQEDETAPPHAGRKQGRAGAATQASTSAALSASFANDGARELDRIHRDFLGEGGLRDRGRNDTVAPEAPLSAAAGGANEANACGGEADASGADVSTAPAANPAPEAAPLTLSEQKQLNARFQTLDEATRVEITDEALEAGVLPTTTSDDDGAAGTDGAGQSRVDWANTDGTVLAYFLRDAFARRNIHWRDPP